MPYSAYVGKKQLHFFCDKPGKLAPILSPLTNFLSSIYYLLPTVPWLGVFNWVQFIHYYSKEKELYGAYWLSYNPRLRESVMLEL